MLMPAISQYMSREPYSIPSSSSAATAKSVMRSHLVRHLAILDGPEVIGVVAGADLEAMTKLTDLDLENVSVSRVMTKPVTVWGSAPLDEVADMMSEKKVDCVVVLGGHGLQGIFTATDALRALAELLQRTAG